MSTFGNVKVPERIRRHCPSIKFHKRTVLSAPPLKAWGSVGTNFTQCTSSVCPDKVIRILIRFMSQISRAKLSSFCVQIYRPISSNPMASAHSSGPWTNLRSSISSPISEVLNLILLTVQSYEAVNKVSSQIFTDQTIYLWWSNDLINEPFVLNYHEWSTREDEEYFAFIKNDEDNRNDVKNSLLQNLSWLLLRTYYMNYGTFCLL